MGTRMSGKTALVTGVTSNIGRAIAAAFASEGAHVAVSGRNGERGEKVVGGIRASGGRADFVRADLDGSASASRALAGEAERGGGAVVNISSWLASLGAPAATAYNATKGAMETLTRDWAAEFGPSGVRVNAISPGVIRDPASGEGSPEAAEAAMRCTPAGKSGPPEAVAHAAVYLAGDEAAFVHGTVLDVDGGRASVAVFGA